MKNIATSLIALLSIGFSHYSTAQGESSTNDSPKWYQIEVLVFANNNSQDASQENWSQELGLKYPQRIVKLKTAAQREFLFGDSDQNTPLDNPADNALTANPIDQTNHTEISSSSNTAVSVSEEQAFVLLDQQQLQLTTMAQRITSQADFRQLFHAAWRQPMNNREESSSILIQGGQQFDKHFELEGSIKLSVERYLHLQTNLWLSQFSSNVGREPLPWPVLPNPPFSLNIDLTTSNIDGSLNNTDFTHSHGHNKFGGQFTGHKLNSKINNTSQSAFPLFGFDNSFYDVAGNLYSVEQTYTLRQNRRMRSGELHYIDHPLLGLLIKVTPYEPTATETDITTDDPAALP